MQRVIIWVIDGIGRKTEKTDYSLEVYLGWNKHTKSGTYSGPLWREPIELIYDNPVIRFIFSLDEVSQTGKNKIRLSSTAIGKLMLFFDETNETALYCRMIDRKPHKIFHVNSFHQDTELTSKQPVLHYDRKTCKLLYRANNKNSVISKRNDIAFIPTPRLYLYTEARNVRGFLNYLYNDIEVEYNSNAEEITTDTGVVLRNVRFENDIYEILLDVGGVRSVRNEITFPGKFFFLKIMPLLTQTEVELYWGKRKQKISKATISCNISYDMDWFSLSGTVSNDNSVYQLSDLLRKAQGKQYVELSDGLFFLPEEFSTISPYPSSGNNVRIPIRQFAQINQIASKFQIDPEVYLKRLSDTSGLECVIPESVDQYLRAYQREGVRWMFSLYNKELGGCLADDMGLGKTIQTIAFLCCLNKAGFLPILIIVPKVVLDNWKSEFDTFAPDINVEIAYRQFSFDQPMKENTVYLTTYETVVNHQKEFQCHTFESVILDEAQYLKNYRTLRYRAVDSLKRRFTLALTGTPVENNLDELWSLMEMLNPGFLGSHGVFLRLYRNANDDQQCLRRLNTIIGPFFLRRTKKEVLKDLPMRTEQYCYCEMEEEQRTLYDMILSSAVADIKAKASRYMVKDNAAVLQALLYLRETCVDPQLLPPEIRGKSPSRSCKFGMFKERIIPLVKQNDKVIVFSQFPRVLKKLETWCNSRSIHTYYIDGETNNRQLIVNRFEESQSGVFFISLKAGGLGLNLVSCQCVIIYEPWWNSAAEQQASDRVYRIGQKKPVYIYHFLVRDTVEEKIWELQNKKKRISEGVLGNEYQPNKLPIEEIIKMLNT